MRENRGGGGEEKMIGLGIALLRLQALGRVREVWMSFSVLFVHKKKKKKMFTLTLKKKRKVFILFFISI